MFGRVSGKSGEVWIGIAAEYGGHFDLWTITALPGQHTVHCQKTYQIKFKQVTTGYHPNPEHLLEESLFKTSLTSVDYQREVACFDWQGLANVRNIVCIRRNGEKLSTNRGLPTTTSEITGTYETLAINSHIPRCRWHRVRLDIDIPDSSAYRVSVATSNVVESPPDFAWQELEDNVDDFLIDQPPGQFLFLKLQLTGQPVSPVLHRVRIDFPRVTSLEQLPAIYRQDPEAEDFTERFLSLFDSTTEHIDEVVEQLPAILNVDSVHQDLLPWLAGFLGIAFDSDLTIDQRRKILNAAPELYQKRGTVKGLKQAIELILGLDQNLVVIRERALHRAWGIVNQNSRLGQMRLFGRSKSRYRLGSSLLGVAPLTEFGNPDHDMVRQDAYRFEVLVPPIGKNRNSIVNQLNRLIESQKPAHTQHTVRMGGEGFIVGRHSAIGVDTKFVAPPPVVLSDSDDSETGIRLGEGVLHAGLNRPTSGLRPGVASSIGIHTTLE